MSDPRTQEIDEGLRAIRERIRKACTECGRDPDDITLIVVTKTFPADDVERLVELGVRDVGENRDQEARPKAEQVTVPDLRWHFIGQLQSNKASHVAQYADVVHSVDRVSLVDALEKGAQRAGRNLDCLVQVNLDPPDRPGRGGVAPEDALALADAIAAGDHLRVRGVMGVAPLDGDAGQAFATLYRTWQLIRSRYPDADVMSAGMSDDLEEAIGAGATHLRVGSAILGSRPALG